MTEEEGLRIKQDIEDFVNKRMDDQAKAYNEWGEAYAKNIQVTFLELMPKALRDATTKPNYWMPILYSVVEGAVLGAIIYLAITGNVR